LAVEARDGDTPSDEITRKNERYSRRAPASRDVLLSYGQTVMYERYRVRRYEISYTVVYTYGGECPASGDAVRRKNNRCELARCCENNAEQHRERRLRAVADARWAGTAEAAAAPAEAAAAAAAAGTATTTTAAAATRSPR
jgi:hypothetical protein